METFHIGQRIAMADRSAISSRSTLTGELREQPRRARVQYAAPYAPDPVL